MKMTFRRGAAVLASAIGLGASLFVGGCNAETRLTSQEQANIKGNGQMPAEARQKLAEQLRQANQKMQKTQPGSGR